jgi:hypothetical protein
MGSIERLDGTNAGWPVSAKGMGRGGSLNLMGSKTMRTVWRWVAIAGFATATALGQSVATAPAKPAATVVEPPAPLLPTNNGLVADDARAAVPADRPETAAILAEDGLKRTETRATMVPIAAGTARSGWVRAYQFVDATGAFAAYTYFRQGGHPLHRDFKGASVDSLPDGELVFLSGVSVVRAKTNQYPDSVVGLLLSIEAGLPKVSGPRSQPPLLPTLFPKEGLDAAGLRYALGPVGYRAMGGQLPPEILGWDKSAEVAVASYAGRGGKGTLTLLMYPTPQIAGELGRVIEQSINQEIKERGAAAFGTVKLKRLGPLVEMTSGGFTSRQAAELVGAVRLNQEVTFDKQVQPSFHAEIRKTYTLMQSIAVFCGIGALAAIMLGVFLGGGRAAYRVMRGKSAASEPEFLSINLRDNTLPQGEATDKPRG